MARAGSPCRRDVRREPMTSSRKGSTGLVRDFCRFFSDSQKRDDRGNCCRRIVVHVFNVRANSNTERARRKRDLRQLNRQRACRNCANGEPANNSYHTVTSVPSSHSMVEGYPMSPEIASSLIVNGSLQLRPLSSLTRARLPIGLRRCP